MPLHDSASPDHVPTDRIRVERGPDGLRALDPDRGLVHRVLPADARAIAAGHADAYADHLRGEVLDAVEQALAAPRWDRRRVLSSSAALAGAGIATVLLPSAAAASSVGGVAFGSGFASSIEVTPTDLSALSSTYVDGVASVYSRAYGRWVVPTGVTTVQVIATGTSGGLAGPAGTPSPAPYTGAAGSGAQAVGTFSVTEGHTLVVVFSGAQRWSSVAGGDGGSAAGVGDLGTGSSGDWLIVGGGGGGGAQAGVTSNTPTYANVAGAYTQDYVGGDGGDAGTGGTAAAGLTGSGTAAGSTGTGGGGGTLSAGGSGGTGGINGAAGGAPSGPTSVGSTTALGIGGLSGNNTASGGQGGGGLYGGGAGGSTGFFGASGGGGGGSSYLRTARLAPGTPSEIELLNRAIASGPRVIIYY